MVPTPGSPRPPCLSPVPPNPGRPLRAQDPPGWAGCPPTTPPGPRRSEPAVPTLQPVRQRLSLREPGPQVVPHQVRAAAPPAEALLSWERAVLAGGQEPAFRDPLGGRPTAAAPTRPCPGRLAEEAVLPVEQDGPGTGPSTPSPSCHGGESGRCLTCGWGDRARRPPGVATGPPCSADRAGASCPGPEPPHTRTPSFLPEGVRVTPDRPRRLGGHVQGPQRPKQKRETETCRREAQTRARGSPGPPAVSGRAPTQGTSLDRGTKRPEQQTANAQKATHRSAGSGDFRWQVLFLNKEVTFPRLFEFSLIVATVASPVVLAHDL